MKKIFMRLLDVFDLMGNITEALMYSTGDFSRIKVETEQGNYSITISKETENDGNS